MGHDYSRGMHWIGHPGTLHPIIDSGNIDVSDDHAVQVTENPFSGKRRVRTPRGRAMRTWQLSIPNAHADEIADVRTLLAATMPPWTLVTADAQVSNVLTPEGSVLADATPTLGLAGGWPVEGRVKPTVFTRANPAAGGGALGVVRTGIAAIPPVWTQRPATISILLGTDRSGGARAGIEWLNAAGNPMATTWGEFVTGMDMLRRSHATAVVPWGASACRIITQYAEVLSEPQVTWTAAVIPEWSPGNGADRVSISGSQRGTDMAVPERYGLRRSDYSVTLVETTP